MVAKVNVKEIELKLIQDKTLFEEFGYKLQ